MDDVQVEGLVPAALAGLPAGGVPGSACRSSMRRWRNACKAARARNGAALRRLARCGDGQASVGLVELDRSHTFANINLTDNVVRFMTRRYNENPLVVQGPGAGPEVTAGGVFADLLRVCAYLGAKL